MTRWPSTTVPWESTKIGLPFGPVTCRECKRTAEPEPVLTCLGDFVLRLGGWCKNCRLFVCLLEMTYELAFKTPPWKFLVYDKKLPVNFDCWPEVSRQTFDMREFEFGENDLTGETTE